MRVTVRLFASLRGERLPEENLVLPPGTTVAGVMATLAIPADRVTLVFVNGLHASPDAVLRDGDALALFPPVGGG